MANFCRLSLADSREMLNFAASTVFIHLNYNAYEKEIKQKKCENGENVWQCRIFYLLLPMKTEFGKWLMDIAKYMVTALLLSTIFADMKEPVILYIVVLITPIILGYGLYWVNEGKKEENVKSKRR